MMNMKCVLMLVVFIAGCIAEITFDTSNIANGEYSYRVYDGLFFKDETGKLDSEGNSVVTGQYRYVIDGKEYIVDYVADKDGYHPKLTIMDFMRVPAFGAPPALVASLLG